MSNKVDEKLAEIRRTEDGKVYLVDKVGNKYLLTPWDEDEE